MTGPRMIDISADLSEELRQIDREPCERNSVEDRVLAATLRNDGYDDERLIERFGYVPEKIEKGSWRSLLPGNGGKVSVPAPEPHVERVIDKAPLATKRRAEMG